MHNDANKRGHGPYPLEKIMMDIKDTSLDIRNTAGWLGIPDPYWGGTKNSKKYLNSSADMLDSVYNRLRELTGLHPCK